MMRSTGTVRQIDGLRRLVIPVEVLKTKGIKERDAVEIFTDGENIILRKYQPWCLFCGDAEDVVNFKGKNMCRLCLAELVRRVG